MLVSATLPHSHVSAPAGPSTPPVEPWQATAAAKKAAQLASLPKRWLLPEETLSSLPSDVRPLIRESGLLTARQLEITELDEATVLLGRLARREYSAVEVAEAFCGRATLAHQLTNCLTEVLFDSALSRAAELDEHLERTGAVVGPLHGLPISLKDQFDVEGVDSTIGFVSLCGKPAMRNSVLVDLLLQMGAIAAETNNNVFGRTVNPRNRSLTSGGSSGGEGALLALKGSILGVGTDFGGSIRVPSHACGLHGLRPTTRRLPYARVSNVLKGFEGIESTIGPMARSVDSLEVFMRAVIGAEPWLFDAKVVERPWIPLSPPGKKLHVAFAVDNGLVHSHPPIRRAILETVDALRAAGHIVTELAKMDFRLAGALLGKIASADGGADLRTFLEATNEPIIPEAFPFTTAAASTVYELSQTIVERDEYRQRFLEIWRASAGKTTLNTPFDLILCPVLPQVAHPHRGRPQESELITWTTTWSLLDLPCCTLPVGELDPCRDAACALPEAAYSDFDQQHWDEYSPERHEDAPLVVQLVSPRRFREDELLAMVKVVEEAVKAATEV
ncbi:hypothetical protein JCM10450v2_000901 [Rhodotorula kratochvilovae]